MKKISAIRCLKSEFAVKLEQAIYMLFDIYANKITTNPLQITLIEGPHAN